MTDVVEIQQNSAEVPIKARVRGPGGGDGQRVTGEAGASARVPDRTWDTWEERDWDRVLEQLSIGDCTPFLGADASPGTVELSDELARKWIDDYDYPFDNAASVHDVAQYVSVEEGDRILVKRRFAHHLSTNLPDPKFQDPTEPHTLLARFPIKVHLTTSYDDFMTRALQRADKRPTTAICPWYEGAQPDEEMVLPTDYVPQVDEPLVYHLHGSVRHPPSLVLAERDHLEFVRRLATDMAADDRHLVPTHVLRPLATQPLLFLGYSLRDWSFRLLLHGFVEAVANIGERRHVSVQLAPDSDTDDPDQQQRALEYLAHYFEKLNISVYWGSAAEFCTELHRRLENL